jgi:NAD(P)H-hydrate epimerase
MGLATNDNPDLARADLILDALIGYSLSGDPRGAVAEWIERVNVSKRPVLALDTPSGLDTTTGIPAASCIRAKATMTLALPKTGLLTPQAQSFVGDLYVADISVPPELYKRIGVTVAPIFSQETIIHFNKGN